MLKGIFFYAKKEGGNIDIIFSANNGEEVRIIPVLPEKLPTMEQSYNNTTFESINGDINLIGTKGLRTVELSSFFPVFKNYCFMRPGSEQDGWMYVAFFNKWADRKVPIRMVWIDDKGREISNMAYTIESFSVTINKIKDIEYTLSLKEYRFIKDAKR